MTQNDYRFVFPLSRDTVHLLSTCRGKGHLSPGLRFAWDGAELVSETRGKVSGKWAAASMVPEGSVSPPVELVSSLLGGLVER